MKKILKKLKEIPDSYIDEIQRDIGGYTVSLYRDLVFLGSGTLVKVNEKHGILTARHVLSRQNPPLELKQSSKDDTLVLSDYRGNIFGLPYACLTETIVGEPKSDQLGPDLTFIEILSCPELVNLKAKKGFWSLEFNSMDRLKTCYESGNTIMFVGFPSEKSEDPAKSGNVVTIVGFYQGLIGGLKEEKKFESNGFDFIEFNCHYGSNPELPKNYGGMSGGGIWLIETAFRDGQYKYDHDDLILCGVGFYQEGISEGIMMIRGHFAKSVYENTVERIMEE